MPLFMKVAMRLMMGLLPAITAALISVTAALVIALDKILL